MIQFFAKRGQIIGASASESVLSVNIQDWFPLGFMGWISLQSKGLSRVFSKTTVQSINSLALSFLYSPTLTSIHDYWGKKIPSPAHFFAWVICFSDNPSWTTYIFWRLILCHLFGLQLFSSILKVVFHLVYSSLCCVNAFKFNYIPFVYFSYFYYSRRWIKEDRAAIYIKECSVYILL